MAKRPSDSSDKVQKKLEKVKGAGTMEAGKQEGGFSLFSGKGDLDLEDVFSKGTAYVAPTAPAITARPVASPIVTSLKPSSSNTKKSKASTERSSGKARAGSKPRKALEDSDDEDEDEEVEEQEGQDDLDENASDASSSSSGSQELVHEALKPIKSPQGPAKRYIPEDESSADRDRRTVFVGNLPLDVATSKSALSQLRQHILTYCPGAKIESSRLRSVPFAMPTTTRPVAEGKEKPQAPTPDQGTFRTQREKQRTAAWRGETGEEGGSGEGKVFLDSKGKRKVAFIKKDFHASAKTCNAYIVFAHSPPDRPTNLPPILDPLTAAEQALGADGSSFLDHLIRVDSVHSTSSAKASTVSKTDWLGGADPKLSIFVGGLDYETKENELRTFFEELVTKERGEREKKYVTSVRVIRDKDTQMGKGFGYVHFAEAESVDEMMGIETRLKFAKRPIRLQRCKATQSNKIPRSDPSTVKSASTVSGKSQGSAPRAKERPALPRIIPKGDPKLGDRLKGLSKDERKVAKASDADRLARRLAKKKLKHRSDESREKGAVKLGGGDKHKGQGHGGKAKKGRVRSEHALTKMKGARN